MDMVAAGYVWLGHPCPSYRELIQCWSWSPHFLPSITFSWQCLPAKKKPRADSIRAILGMEEISKPAELAKRGGCWFKSGVVQIHVGGEHDFRAAKKAHPALKCADYEGLISRLCEVEVEVTQAHDIPGVRRCHIHYPLRNRIALMSGEPL